MFNNAFSIATTTATQTIRDAYIKKILVDRLPTNNRYMGVTRQITYPTKGFPGLYKTTNNLYMWGMQLPHQFDRDKLLQTFLYLIETKEIYAIVDLQDCVGTNTSGHPDMALGIGCNPYDISCSEDVYYKVISSVNPVVPPRYHRISTYFDMSAGFPSAWLDIYRIYNTNDKNNSVVVHCLGGKGRTGSVLLYLYMRDNIPDVRRRLTEPHFGYNDIAEFIFNMNQLLFNEQTTAQEQQNKNEASREVFKIGGKLALGQSVSRLLRQRVNRILFYLARGNRIGSFYMYECPTGGTSPNDEFRNIVLQVVDWDLYDRGGYNNDMIKHKEWFD
jgi:hypothetical protein